MSTRRLAITFALMYLVASGCSDEPDSDTGDTGSADGSVADTADGGPGDATDATDAADDAASETGDIADAGDTSASLSWETCHSDYECTDVEVPLDYETSGGETMTIPVIRKPAANPSEKIGTVMFNFGGPGASGVTIAANDMFPLLPVGFPKIHKRFDVVVVEPRGTAKSSPAVDCLDDTEIDAMRQLDTMPDNESDWNELASNWESFVDGCLETHPKKYLAEINTENVVRDMDTVRQKLGEETINFVGISYGTYVGALYANMYPDRVRAFALDSNMHPTRQNLVDHISQGAGDLRLGLEQFFDDCGNDDSCPFHGGEGAAAVESALSQLFSELESSPLELENGRKVTTRDATMALVATLRDGAHDKLANALSDAESGDGQKLMKFADVFWMRNDDGSYGSFIEAYITNMIADSTCP
ncbi:MAG: alpha/beta fold hydrolase, partial [Bradymonadaceae bacterium]